MISKSAKISSVLIISTSLIGSTAHSTCVTLLSLKYLSTCTMASTSLMWERNLFPNPSPLLAHFTRPAISTNSILEYIFFLDCDISASVSTLGSFTSTIPIFGFIVQKGKFSAGAAYDLVNALKRVDFPIFGIQTIPIFIPIDKMINAPRAIK